MILPLAAVYMMDRGLATAAFEHSSLRWNDASIAIESISSQPSYSVHKFLP